MDEPRAPGIVYLVGGGPGDPGLITVQGLERVRCADVLVYDRLVGEALVAAARPDCERIYVGKQASRHALRQEEINALLVARCRAGQVVTRLKGGDPFVFGRGGEEAEALVAAGLPFEIVPGVTSAIAAPAYAGIPVTHRALTSSVHIITGHEDPTRPESRLRWEHLAPGDGTLVFLMGIERLDAIAGHLITHGRPATTPVAVVEWGTWPRQHTVTGTLADIAARVSAAGIEAPAVTVVGEVVRLRERLAWFDRRPLFGKRVLVTRARAQASALSDRLTALGAVAIELPAIRIVPGDDGPLDTALTRLATVDWVIFTSVNGVARVFERLDATGRDARAFGLCQLCAIGPATAAALAERGLRADRVPPEAVAEGILAAFEADDLTGRRVLLPQGDQARDTLAAGLAARGAIVEAVVAYRTTSETDVDPATLRLVRDGAIDAVTLTSSSTARNLVAALGGDLTGLEQAVIVAIGPITARTATDLGLTVAATAADHTISGLADALVAALALPPRSPASPG
ncbi:MAG: uroporphyrinogen-III C-methyltransferase [Chloroflexi bacterium]|nr:uroporphyrinogen-III C-methyltransferase [Chloroflexota bacterium]